jgi:hypothetical protein
MYIKIYMNVMLKKYFEFIKESEENLGNWIEELYQKDKSIISIVRKYITDKDPSINLASSIDTIDSESKSKLKQDLDSYLNNNSKTEVSTSTREETEIKVNNKGLFKILLKLITALGLKDKVEKVPKWEDWLVYYNIENVNVKNLKNISVRFQSINNFVEKINYDLNHIDIYYGIKDNNIFEFGFVKEGEFVIKIGEFVINNSNLKFLISLDSPSATLMKRDFVNLDNKKVKDISKIKSAIQKFEVKSDTKTFQVAGVDNILEFGFKGLGEWNDQKLTESFLSKFKLEIKEYLRGFKWSDKIQISIKSGDFWVYLLIKSKN